jgi:predicted phage terminase large subunit-like protein
LEKKVNAKLHGVFNSVQKESRILSRSTFINDYFIFFKERRNKVEYNQYFIQLLSFSLTEKNEHDDAPDSTAGLAKFCSGFLKMNKI